VLVNKTAKETTPETKTLFNIYLPKGIVFTTFKKFSMVGFLGKKVGGTWIISVLVLIDPRTIHRNGARVIKAPKDKIIYIVALFRFFLRRIDHG
jgi:D-alanyl-lipoteichoic acid acyltransferase DltB (MBOAT superfamily)